MEKVIATFTTIPSRIKFVEPVIESLMCQTFVPHEIHIQIPRHSLKENCSYEIPAFFQKYDRVRVKERGLDFGSATKWVYPLEDFKTQEDSILIILDDDCQYHPNSIELLINRYRKNQDDCICFTGGKFPTNGVVDSFGKGVQPIDNTLTIIEKNQDDLLVDTIQGFSMFLVRPYLFNEFNFSGLNHNKIRLLSDDIVISGIMEFLKIRKIQVGPFLVPNILEQADINAIHGDGRLLKMTLIALKFVQQEYKVWDHINVQNKSHFVPRIKGFIKKWVAPT